MLFAVESTLIQLMLLALAGAIGVGATFYLLNRRDSREESRFYANSFDPKKKFAANVVADANFERDPDPAKALKAYSATAKEAAKPETDPER